MSSGEADVYHYTITNGTWPLNNSNEWWVQPSTTTYWSTPVYYYQITCPRCGHLNWGEVDRIIVCKGETQARNNRRVACGARIKAVLEQVDFEIPVDKP